jgi:hypothetical protein
MGGGGRGLVKPEVVQEYVIKKYSNNIYIYECLCLPPMCIVYGE